MWVDKLIVLDVATIARDVVSFMRGLECRYQGDCADIPELWNAEYSGKSLSKWYVCQHSPPWRAVASVRRRCLDAANGNLINRSILPDRMQGCKFVFCYFASRHDGNKMEQGHIRDNLVWIGRNAGRNLDGFRQNLDEIGWIGRDLDDIERNLLALLDEVVWSLT